MDPGDGGGPAQPKKREYEPGTLSYKLDKFRSKLPKALQQLIPVSTEEVTEEGSKLATTSFTFTSSISFQFVNNHNHNRTCHEHQEGQSGLPRLKFFCVVYKMPCEVTLYEHKDYGGRSIKLTKSTPDLDKTSFGRNGATSYKVNADEGCLITAWSYPDYGDRGRYLRGNEPNLGHRRKWNDNNWNDDIDSVKIEQLPRDPDNFLEYALNVPHYLPSAPYDTYCGGCRWWPQASPHPDCRG